MSSSRRAASSTTPADLMERMVNPWLNDLVARVIRDPRRKLGWNDRLIGTMRLVLDAGIAPRRFAEGAAAALAIVGGEIRDLWPEPELAARAEEGARRN